MTGSYPLQLKPAWRRQAYWLLAALVLLVSSCSRQAEEHHYSLFSFGTLIDITLYDTDRETADLAFQILQTDFDRYHQQWSPWVEGDLYHVNQALAESRRVPLPESLDALVRNSIELSELTEGHYNPAIGKLINLWQFHRYEEEDFGPPEDAAIRQLLVSAPSMDDVHIDADGYIYSDNPDVLLNFGAYAKGYSIQLGLETLQRLGIENAIINTGGDLGVIGRHGERPWHIGIRHPRRDTLLASVEVHADESVFTSGDYERYFHLNGKRYHHIFDPNTGYPTTDAQSVTVIHDDPGYADAVATALFVAGSDDWQRIAQRCRMRYVMLVDRNGDIHLTPAMKERIEFIDKSSTSHIFLSKEL